MRCFFCKDSHHIANCKSFLGKDVEEKKTFVMAKGLCFGCLKRNHLYKDCKNRNPKLMESKQDVAATQKAQPNKKDEKEDKKTTAAVAKSTAYKISTGSGEGVLHSMILPVMLSHQDNPSQHILTYALLDNMSDSCFIKADLLSQLQADGTSIDLEVTTLVEKKVVRTNVVEGLNIRGWKESTVVQMPKTYSQDDIPTDRGLIPRPETARSWSHLKSVAKYLHPYQEDLDVGILIGANCSAALMPKEVIADGDSDPYALRTCLGWGVIGWVGTPEDVERKHSARFVYKTSVREISPSEIKRMFEMEFSENVQEQKVSIEDRRFIDIADAGLHQRTDGHFEMPLPLKQDVQLPNNRVLAMKRLNQLKAKLMKDEKFKGDYTSFMGNVIERGYAEPVPPEEIQGPIGRTWYIPHHGVYHPKKPEKIRIVYDCSAVYQGEFLNR